MGIVYPKKCFLCGEPLSLTEAGAAVLCESCARAVRRDYRLTDGLRIEGTDGAAAALRYTGLVAEAMKRFKFSHYQHYAPWFAAQLAPLLAAELAQWQPDLVTYLPISLARWYQRGYNQAELIARPLAQQFSLACAPVLKKRFFVKRQSQQRTPAARRKNVQAAFRPIPHTDLTGKSVVLVDDIVTTGASLSAAAAVLRQMGAARVYALAAARARR